ncbi:hypothetical protein DIE08_18385 [Burkholderia sp. Bp9004]|nr:hypothetical protein DIE08_18385 [Burkholderia sp. Bp9004]
MCWAQKDASLLKVSVTAPACNPDVLARRRCSLTTPSSLLRALVFRFCVESIALVPIFLTSSAKRVADVAVEQGRRVEVGSEHQWRKARETSPELYLLSVGFE